MKLLVVDDHADNRLLLRELLESDGYEVDEAANGLEALDQARAFPPDLIISDILMPQMDGFTLCRVLKGIEALRHIPVVFYTATYLNDDDESLGLAVGASYYIRKPEEPKSFLSLIKVIAEKARDGRLSVREAGLHGDTSLQVLHEARIADKLDKKIRDVDRLRSEQALILSSAGEGILGLDLEGRHTIVNRTAADLLGYEVNELIGVDSHSLWHHTRADGSPFPEAECPIAASMHDGRSWRQVEDLFWRRDGSSFMAEYSSSPLLEDGEVKGVVVMFRDITERKQAEKDKQKSMHQIRSALLGTIQAVALTIEKRDPYTAGHQQRVAALAAEIGREMGLSEDVVEGIQLGGSVHDIGKISIPYEILNRPGKLTETEFKMIKSHAQEGYEIIRKLQLPWPVADMIYQHHERLDGSGYPRGLKGDEIILEARILSVADVVEAITSHRPYRPALGLEVALEEIRARRGSWFEPDAVDACLRVIEDKGFTFA